MASRKKLKHSIELICSDLLAECIAVSLYDTETKKEDIEALLRCVIKMESNYISRISHIQPGLSAKLYFKDLKEKFSNEVNDIVDQINNMH